MADVKISALPASTTPLAGTEVLPIVQSGSTVQVSVANLTAGRAVSALSLTSTTTLGVTGTSTLSGNAIVSVTDNTNAALRITQLGTGDALLVEDSTNPDATPFLINATGEILRGATTAVTVASELDGTQASAGITNASVNNSAALALLNYTNTTTNSRPAYMVLGRSNGAPTTQTTVDDADELGALSFQGSDGTNFVRAASIKAIVDGTPGTNDMPGRLVFSTTADGASSPTERMRISSSGTVGIGGSGTAGVNLDIRKIITGAVSAFGVNVQATIQSDVTTTTSSFQTFPSTAAAAFTLTSLRHFDADQGTIGVGSTVTNQYGFRANSTITGATNNYGFFSNIADAANRFNFYAAGTADNFFTGKVSTNSFVTAFAATATPAGGTANTGYNMGSAGVGIIWGSGAPTATMPAGSIYLRTDGSASSRIYSTSGGGTWLAITSL